MRKAAVLGALFLALALPETSGATSAEVSDELPRIQEKAKGLERLPALFPMYVDSRRGKLWLELPPPEGALNTVAEVLYAEGLVQGLGSNPVGLDRGQLGPARVVRIRRLGTRVVFEVINLGFRDLSGGEPARRAAEESFATSVLWAGEIGALDPDGRSLLEMTGFAVRDAHGVTSTLKATGQGVFKLDLRRSALDSSACRGFPDNIELQAVLTYAGSDVGAEVRSTSPVPDAVTLVQHLSLLRLPPDGYSPRRGDPRIGVFGIQFMDFGAGLTEPLETDWIVRHRLERQDGGDPDSPVREPIVYYVDSGAPEPIRSALVEGASWWVEAFEAAGFPGAFRVEILPADVHPLDIRYNVIQWAHRQTRGWSFGGGVVDPRTGEMIKAHVTLGSLRVRHDRLLFEGLVSADRNGTGAEDDPVELALARIRQLSAHEVGHTLGLAHNFAASAFGRASVMDYPAPLVQVTSAGELDFSQAYGVGIGPWDTHCIRYAYFQPVPDDDEEAILREIVEEGLERGFVFLSDADSRARDAADPRASLWDNLEDPVEALELTLEVRRLALSRFGRANVADGRPLAHLRQVLAPLYLHHRYQLEAAAKVLGGVELSYAVRGDGQVPVRIVDADHQRRAVQAVLRILDPQELDLPDEILDLMPPPAFGAGPSREDLSSWSGPSFDVQAAATAVADHALSALLEPGRLARVVEHHRRDSSLPSMESVLVEVTERAFGAPSSRGRSLELQWVVQWATVRKLVELAASHTGSPVVGAQAEAHLRSLASELAAHRPGAMPEEAAHRQAMSSLIARFLDRGLVEEPGEGIRHLPLPPGSPIGAAQEFCSFR